jgi:hypothetical protein
MNPRMINAHFRLYDVCCAVVVLSVEIYRMMNRKSMAADAATKSGPAVPQGQSISVTAGAGGKKGGKKEANSCCK